MDPLSTALGALTLVGACIKGLDILKMWKNAPRSLLEPEEEVLNCKLVLSETQDLLQS